MGSLEAILGERQNSVPLGPPLLDTMALVRVLQQGCSREDSVFNHQRGMFDGELPEGNNLRDLLKQSEACPGAFLTVRCYNFFPPSRSKRQ